jgi:hypothetical protein
MPQTEKSFGRGPWLRILAALLIAAPGGKPRAAPTQGDPSLVTDAMRIAARTIDPAAIHRLPLGYPGLLALFTGSLGEDGTVRLVNAGSLLAFVGCASAWLRFIIGKQERAATALGSAMALLCFLMLLAGHPYVLLTLVRANESLLAAALLTGFVLLLASTPTALQALAVGVLLGGFAHVRPNSLSLLLPAGIWLLLPALSAPVVPALRRCVLAGFALLAGLLVTYSSLAVALSGDPFYRPTNGGYNLYAGNNPFALAKYNRNQNGEYSLGSALRNAGRPGSIDPHQVPEQDYTDLATAFVKTHPAAAAELLVVKAEVFFAPRLANAHSRLQRLLQLAAATPFYLGLALAIGRFVRRRNWLDGSVLLVVLAYCAPFILTNADPRMRFPLDMMMLPYLGACVAPWLVSCWMRRPRSARAPADLSVPSG